MFFLSSHQTFTYDVTLLVESVVPGASGRFRGGGMPGILEDQVRDGGEMMPPPAGEHDGANQQPHVDLNPMTRSLAIFDICSRSTIEVRGEHFNMI